MTITLLAALLPLSACGGSEEAASTAPTPEGSSAASSPAVKVATSTDVYGAIVKAIGGDQVEVTSFIDNPAADPEAYESTPADAAALSAAELVIGNGGGYDDFVFQLAEAAGGEREVLDVTEFSGLEGKVPAGEEFNEHLWFNLSVVTRLAERIADDLGTLRPESEDLFAENLTAFNDKVGGLEEKVAAIKSAHEGTRVAATEPLPLYLLDDAGLENATPEEFLEASEEGTDAPAAVVQETLELVTGPEPVSAILLNTQTQTAASDRLRAAAKQANIPEVPVNETLSDGFEEYVPWIGAQIDALSEALDKTA